MPDLLKARHVLALKLLRYWGSYTVPNPRHSGLYGFDRVIHTFEAMMGATVEGIPTEDPRLMIYTVAAHCWYGAAVASLLKTPGASPPSHCPIRPCFVPHPA